MQVFYSRGSQPFGTRVPPNRYFTPLRTPLIRFYHFAYPHTIIGVLSYTDKRLEWAQFEEILNFGVPPVT